MTDVAEVQEAPAEQSSAHITTDSVKFRTYGTYNAAGDPVGVDSNGNPTDTKPSTSRETADNKGWTAQAKKGATLLSENEYRWYNLLHEEGFADLVPDAEQRLYIIQKGLDQLQTAAVNALQNEVEINGTTKQLKNNGITIDLREDINTPPSRRVLTDEQKFLKTINAIGKDKALSLLEALKAQLMSEAGV